MVHEAAANSPRFGSLGATSGREAILDRFLNRLTAFAGALLDPADQFLQLAFRIFEIVIGEPRPLLLQLPFGDVPVTFDF